MKRTGLGERDIIRRLTERFAKSGNRLPLGFEDDVAAYPMTRQQLLVLKTDTLVGSTDVPPGMGLKEASRKAVVSTISDFAAKGVQPAGLLISLALPSPVSSQMVNELASGIQSACEEYHCRVIGGDTGESSDLLIDCIGFGFAQADRIMRRDGARPGDVIAVTGTFGRTGAGLKILLSRKKALIRKFPGLVGSVMHPRARLNAGLRLADSGMVNSSIDSSDGLAWSLHEIARVSKVSMFLDRVPVAPEVRTFADQEGLNFQQLSLYGGEEYELVVTIPEENFARVKRAAGSLIRIGTVEKGQGKVAVMSAGKVSEIEARGWEHMVSKD
jgi:thiamine-monophosphate kinase